MSADLLYPFLDANASSALDESLRQPFRTLQDEARAVESTRKYFFFLFFRRLEPLDAHQAMSVLELIKMCKNKNSQLFFYIEDFVRLMEKQFDLDFRSLVIENYEENKGVEVESRILNTKINYSKVFKAAKKWIRVIEKMRNLQFDTKPLENFITGNICDIDSSSLNLMDITDMIKDYEEINNFLHLEDEPILLATLLNGELRNKEHFDLLKNSNSLPSKEEMLRAYKKYEIDEYAFKEAICKIFDVNFDSIPELKSRIDKYRLAVPIIPQIEKQQPTQGLSKSSPLVPQLNRNPTTEEVKKVTTENSPDRINSEFATTYEEVEPFNMNNLEIKSWAPLREIVDRIIPQTRKLKDVDYYVYKVRYHKPNGQVEEVVVKCHVCPNIEGLAKYKQEADIMAKAYATGSNSFLKILGAFYDIENGKNRFTLVMECCKGSLRDEIDWRNNEGVNYSEKNIMRFLCEMLNACQRLIELRIIHRDIKPANIFVAEKNGETVYKIGDFDASLVSNRSINMTHSTRAGVVGTEIYMAPEIYKAYEETKKLRKNAKDKKLEQLSAEMKERRTITDVFSLGLTVLEMIKLDTEMLQGLNCAPQEEIYEEIDSIEGFEWLKPILRDMLTVDYHYRLSFGNLFDKYYDILREALPDTITE